MHFIVLYVEFEDELATTVSENRATRQSHLQLEIVQFLKKKVKMRLKSRLLFHRPRFFMTV
jgi:hypothetical protein